MTVCLVVILPHCIEAHRSLGVFKTKKAPDGTIVDDPPQFQLFQCLHAPEQSEGGQTVLTNTVDLLRDGLTADQRQWLAEKTWSVYTAKNKVFGGDHLMKLPFIVKNEGSGHDVLRWHEPWYVGLRIPVFPPLID